MSSQPSTSSQPSPQILLEITNDTVVYILSQDHNKYPVKRADIVKNCFRNYGKAFKSVMKEVQIILKTVFGMELVDLESPTGHSNQKQYLLRNLSVFTDTVEDLIWPKEAEAHQVLLMIVLSHIFMSGGVVKEELMWKFLPFLEIHKKVHEYFGDVKKLMTQEFVRQLYLEYNKIPDTNPTKYEFRWGKRADLEVSHRDILKFVSEMHGINMSQWTLQYREVQQIEAQAEGAARSST